MRWGTNEMGDQWDEGPLGLAENGWTNEKGDQWEGAPMSSNNVVGGLWIGVPMRRGPMRWWANEMGDQWVGGTNEMGDQWNEWCMGANWGINEMGDQWDGGPMRWGTNEMGDQWDGGPMMCTQSTGRELRSGVKCIVVTIVTGLLWLVRRYRRGQVNLETISTIPSH